MAAWMRVNEPLLYTLVSLIGMRKERQVASCRLSVAMTSGSTLAIP